MANKNIAEKPSMWERTEYDVISETETDTELIGVIRKKDLIENFIAGINEVDDVMDEWHSYVAEEREKALRNIIEEEKLKAEETRQFIEGAFRDGTVKTTGTDIDKICMMIK